MVARISNAGTITVVNGSTSVVGDADTEFQTAVCKDGDIIFILATAGVQINVLAADPTSDQALTLRWGYEGANESGMSYVIVRLNALEQVAEAYAKLRIMADAVTANVALLGISFDAIAVNVAGLSAYDDQAEDYAVLVLDAGSSRAAIYIMGSGGSGDWSSPIYVTGAVGPQGDPGQATTYVGSGVPSSGLGSDGESYLNGDNGDIYLKASGAWGFLGTIRGTDAVPLFQFSDNTGMADPGQGMLRFNNAAPGSTTAIAIDDETADSGNPDISAWIATWGTVNSSRKGTILVRKQLATGTFALFDVSDVTDNTGWSELTVSHISSSGVFAAGDKVLMTYMPAADATFVINIDGGEPGSIYGGVPSVDGGTP